jgi:hypothetical protein
MARRIQRKGGAKDSDPTGREREIPSLKPGRYTDGLPLDEIRYVECKLILKPNRFTSRKRLLAFRKVMRRPAEKSGVELLTQGFADEPLKIREILFLDTADFRLYNNAFILRRRIPYKDGFPTGDPELVFKFRHTSMQRVAEMDVRPQLTGDYRTKFKAEVLPLKDALGGIRLLFSHNLQVGLSQVTGEDRTSLDYIVSVLPALDKLKRTPGERVELVAGTIVEEVLQDIAVLDFGKGITALANVALWRARGDHRPLIGELAFEIKFKRREDLNHKVMKRVEAFFLSLQQAAKGWIALGATKTGVVYRLNGNPPNAHE